MYIVLVMKGKGSFSCATSGAVKLFRSKEEAQIFIKETNQDGKYWAFAQLVDDGEEIEFYPES